MKNNRFICVIFVAIFSATTASACYGQTLESQQFTLSEFWPANTLSITLDDGPELAGYSVSIAKFATDYALSGKRMPIPLVFFVNGCRIFDPNNPTRLPISQTGNCEALFSLQAPESDLAQIVALGHALGNHTYDHPDMTNPKLSLAETISQLSDMQTMIRKYWPSPIILFRAPYFDWTSKQAANLNSVAKIASLGLTGPIGCDFCGNGYLADGKLVRGDWDCLQTHTPEQCATPYVNAILKSATHSGVIVIHDHQQFVGASDNPQRIIAEILRQLPPDKYHYVRADIQLTQTLQLLQWLVDQHVRFDVGISAPTPPPNHRRIR